MNADYNLNILEYKDDDKSLKKMVERIKINYALMLLLKFGEKKPSS